MNIIVWNLKDGFPPGSAVYCGRNPEVANFFKLNEGSTALGNPFEIHKDGNRQEVIAKFEMQLREKVKKRALAEEEKRLLSTILNLAKEEVYLVCHCWPRDCHAGTIKQVVEEEIRRRELHR